MQLYEKESNGEHERVVFCHDPASNYRAIVAIHSTALGPALGGVRLWHYDSDDEALTDALRLARGMTYKNALAGLPFGGGKSIIFADRYKQIDREQLFRAHGRFVETFKGAYITAPDVGTGASDMAHILKETEHVAGLTARSGDPSPHTAHGVFRAMQASAKERWGSDDLAGKTVAVQGCGHVGFNLAKRLHEAGARLIVSDTNEESVARVVAECGARRVEPGEIYDAEADVFAPCALGGVLNDDTIPRLKVEIVAGAANNQLLESRHGDALAARGILYAPDYVANAGGVLHGGLVELCGVASEEAQNKVRAVYDTLLNVYALARAENVPPHKAADRLAEQRLLNASRDGRASKAAKTSAPAGG